MQRKKVWEEIERVALNIQDEYDLHHLYYKTGYFGAFKETNAKLFSDGLSINLKLIRRVFFFKQ